MSHTKAWSVWDCCKQPTALLDCLGVVEVCSDKVKPLLTVSKWPSIYGRRGWVHDSLGGGFRV